MKTKIMDALQIMAVVLLTGSTAFAMQPSEPQISSPEQRIESHTNVQPIVPAETAPEPVETPTPPIQTAVAPEVAPEPVAVVPAGDCASEVYKYTDWNQKSAYDVMMQESSNNPDNHNDTPSTGDYSIGCFQINLQGYDNLRAKYRDSTLMGYVGPATVEGLEPWLKIAENNVKVAHHMWRSSGWGPWSNHTCKVVLCQ